MSRRAMIDPHVTDEALMIRFQQGDRAAFAALVKELLSPNPADRPQTAEAVLWRLRHIREQERTKRPAARFAVLGRSGGSAVLVGQWVVGARTLTQRVAAASGLSYRRLLPWNPTPAAVWYVRRRRSSTPP